MRNVEHISTLDDPRIAPYRSLKDRDLAREGARFIAEGELVVRRLLMSDYPVESVLLAERRAQEIAPLVPDAVPVYVAPDPLVHLIVGFKFHSGVIACGRRKLASKLDEVASRLGSRATLVVCPDIANTDNLGSLMRIAAGFGADAMILGPQCCDPFYRQAIRVSMGAVFQLNLFQSTDLRRDLARLRDESHVQLVATVVDDDAAEDLQSARRAERIALMFGNEAQGLPGDLLQICDRRITIPMNLGTDSLNVSVAAAVFLYHFTRR
ncbi:MAG TPA: RNA methyltransferase [Tepidisphaeraceae bacterium]|jgi:tRNA G18 (ribose-2'-O)-methylase SpoU